MKNHSIIIVQEAIPERLYYWNHSCFQTPRTTCLAHSFRKYNYAGPGAILDLVDAAVYRTAKLRREHGGVQGFQAARVPKTSWSQQDQVLHALNGRVRVKIQSWFNGSMKVFPAGRHPLHQRERGRSSEAMTSGAAPTSPLEGVLRSMRH